jgi:hypothetical protein
VAVSEEALIVATGSEGAGARLFGYLFDTNAVVELPVGAEEAGSPDVEGRLAVWVEWDYDDSGRPADPGVYGYLLPRGPKVEIVGPERGAGYPQIAGGLVTWVEGAPLETNEELLRAPIFGVRVDDRGMPAGPIESLVPSVVVNTMADSMWTYGLSERYVVWEQSIADGGFAAGVHLLDLATRETRLLSEDGWLPSVWDGTVVFRTDTLMALDLGTGNSWTLDPDGTLPSAAPTFAAYYRSGARDFEVVALGYRGNKEQILAAQGLPYWFSPSIAVSPTYIALATEDYRVRLFRWQGGEQ